MKNCLPCAWVYLISQRWSSGSCLVIMNPIWLILTPTMNNKKYCLVAVFPNGRSHNHATNAKSLSSHRNHHYHLLQRCHHHRHHPNRQHHNHHQRYSLCFQGTILKDQTMFKLLAISNQTVFWTALTMPSIFSFKCGDSITNWKKNILFCVTVTPCFFCSLLIETCQSK